MLEFRKINYDEDLPSILGLIQNNLDPDFTLELFKWKHLENPFGQSYGLLALDGNKVVGLRMFMYWKFYHSEERKILRAVRPVDTVVDESYRGKGLFRKLTLQGLEECKSEYDFIFNTPNENSLPGYLKMGWEKDNHINHFHISFVNPFTRVSHFEEISPASIKLKESYWYQQEICTYKSIEYFGWRYMFKKYRVAYFPKENAYIAYTTNNNYLIVFEIIGGDEIVIRKLVDSLAKKDKKWMVYFYQSKAFKKYKMPVGVKRNMPVVVYKKFEEKTSFGNVDFSLADLEAVF